MSKRKDITIEKIRDLHSQGYTLTKIRQILKCDLSVIRRKIKNTDIVFKIKPKYPVNEEFFYTWSHNLAYILGFLMSDGCITERRAKNTSTYILQINLQIGDIDILEKIRDIISPTRPIRVGKDRLSPTSNNRSTHCILYMSISVKLFQYLCNLGIKSNKTGSEIIPPQLPEEYIWSFILGFMDGDGGIHERTYNSGFDFTIHSSSETIADQLLNIIPYSKKQIVNRLWKGKPAKTMYKVRVRCLPGIKFLKENLYKNTTLSLNRKRLIFDKVI